MNDPHHGLIFSISFTLYTTVFGGRAARVNGGNPARRACTRVHEQGPRGQRALPFLRRPAGGPAALGSDSARTPCGARGWDGTAHRVLVQTSPDPRPALPTMLTERIRGIRKVSSRLK